MRIEIRVQPGARCASVGGTYEGALVVRVPEVAEKGRATAASLRAVAEALGVRPRDVRLVAGATSRRKILEVDVDHVDGAARERAERALSRRLDALRRAGGGDGAAVDERREPRGSG